MMLNMSELAAGIGLDERYFLTREKGEQAYQRIKGQLTEVPEGQCLVLTFPPDQVMDVSFTDEAIIRLGQEIVAGKFGQRCIMLQGATEDSIRNIEAAIRFQRLKLVFLKVEPDGQWRSIGPLEPTLKETLDLVARRRQLAAPELAEAFALAVNTASNRLKRLFDLRLVWREYEITDRGLQYIYHFWQWSTNATDA